MTTDPKREALAAEVKRLAENYADWAATHAADFGYDETQAYVGTPECKRDRDALHAAIDALSQPPEGEGRAEIGAGPWTVTGPDHPVFRGESPLKAAMEAQRYRRHHDPVEAEKFLAAIDQIRKEGEEEDKRLIALHGSLDCPACGGSGHVGDVSSLTAPSAGHGEGWVSVEDDLPEKNTEVLIFFEGVSALPSTGQYTASVHDHDGWCYPRENFDDASGAWPTVTHWMLLPEPPTPKDNRHE